MQQYCRRLQTHWLKSKIGCNLNGIAMGPLESVVADCTTTTDAFEHLHSTLNVASQILWCNGCRPRKADLLFNDILSCEKLLSFVKHVTFDDSLFTLLLIAKFWWLASIYQNPIIVIGPYSKPSYFTHLLIPILMNLCLIMFVPAMYFYLQTVPQRREQHCSDSLQSCCSAVSA